MRTGIWSAPLGIVILALGAHAASAGELREAREISPAATLSAPAPRGGEQFPPPPTPGPEACAQAQEQARAYQADRAELDRQLLDNHRTFAYWLQGWDSDLWRANGLVLRYHGELGNAGNQVAQVIPNIEREQARLVALLQAIMAACVGTK